MAEVIPLALSAASVAGETAAAGSTLATLGHVATLANTGLGIVQSHNQAAAQQAAVQAQQQAQQNIAYQKQAVEEKQRREQLARDQATARARFGAMGMSGGSSQAVLDGLQSKASQEIADSRSVLDSQWNASNDAFQQQQKRNLLEQQQARQKQLIGLFLGD